MTVEGQKISCRPLDCYILAGDRILQRVLNGDLGVSALHCEDIHSIHFPYYPTCSQPEALSSSRCIRLLKVELKYSRFRSSSRIISFILARNFVPHSR